MNNNNSRNHYALGALNDAVNALNVALGRAAELQIPIELSAPSSVKSEHSVKRWHVIVTQGQAVAPRVDSSVAVLPHRTTGEVKIWTHSSEKIQSGGR